MTADEPPAGSFVLTRIAGSTGWWVGTAQAVCGMPSRWTHAGIALGDGLSLQAEPGGASIGPISRLTGREHVVSDAPVRLALKAAWEAGPIDMRTEALLRARVVDIARTFEGCPYSFLDYAALAALHLHLPSEALRQYVDDSGHLICSALLDRVYDWAGMHLFDDGRYSGDVTPSDLDGWAQAHQGA